MKTIYFGMDHDSPEDVFMTKSASKADNYEYVDEIEGDKGDIVVVTNNDEYISAVNTFCKSDDEMKSKIEQSIEKFKAQLKADKDATEYQDDVVESDGECVYIYSVPVYNLYDEDEIEDFINSEASPYDDFKEVIDSSYVDCDSSSQIQLFTI